MNKPLLIKDEDNVVWEISLLQERQIERFLYTSIHPDQSINAPTKLKLNSFDYPFTITIDTEGYLNFDLEEYYE